MTKSLVEELAGWAVSQSRLGEPARHAARRVLMDQVAVSLAGAAPPIPLAAGSPSATLWANGSRVHAPEAALFNRYRGDDLELTAGPEIGAASIAAAEVFDRTLGDVYLAMAVASEVEGVLRDELQRTVEENGLHPPAVFGAAAAAVAAAKLAGLDPAAFAGALGSAWALTPVSPYAAFSEGATGKWLYGAWSQKLGVSVVLWAKAGIRGPSSVLEGRWGIARGLDVRRPDNQRAPLRLPPLDEPAEAPRITSVTFKPFPVSRACHPALTAIEELGAVEADAIERVEVWSYPFSVDLEERSTKRNRIARQMSVSAAVAGALGTSAPVIVRREGDDALPRVRRARVRVHLKNGTFLEAAAEPKWSGSAPASDDELRDRYLEAAAGRKVLDPWAAPDERPVREAVLG